MSLLLLPNVAVKVEPIKINCFDFLYYCVMAQGCLVWTEIILLSCCFLQAFSSHSGTGAESWWWKCWDVMKHDQIPLSLTSLSLALLVMVIGLLVNILLVLCLIKIFDSVRTRTPSEHPSPSGNSDGGDVGKGIIETDCGDETLGSLGNVCVHMD